MPLDAGWLARLEARLDASPAAPRAALALVVGDAPAAIIGSIEATLALRLAGAGLPLRDAGDAWWLELPAGARVDAAFAELARQLRASAAAAAWRKEQLSVTDTAGRALGAMERDAVRPLGIATAAVHLIVRDPRGRVWVQQRARAKATDPGLWDTTMGGTVSAGEASAESLERETWEEAGLRLAQLHDIAVFGCFTVRRPVPDGYMVEQIEMVEAAADEGVVPVNQDGEVERFECLDAAALVERLHADAFTLEAAMVLVRWLQRTARDPA